jgi:general secretion pathway protein F
MPRFSYKALDRSGSSVADVLEAPSRRDAVRILAARGLRVSGVSEQSGGSPAKPKKGSAGGRSARQGSAPAARRFSFRRRGAAQPTSRDKLPFFEALHDLMSSGLSAGESVRLLSVRIKEPKLRALCAGLWERLSEGATLSRAMIDFPAVFDQATINLINAGEATGSLNETVNRLIGHFTEQREMKRQLLSELAYPVFMMVVSAGVVIFFLVFLLPRLQVLLRSLGGRLPVSTQILVSTSNFAINYGPFLLIGLVVGLILFWQWRGTEAGRAATDRMMLRVPMIGPFAIAQTVFSFSQNLGVLLENGITTAEALRMTERQIGNHEHRDKINKATDRILEGEALSLALQRTGFFPDLVLDRLAVGENTGNVVPSLKDIAVNYRKIISRQLKTFTRIISSGVLTLVFVFVGFIAFSIVSAVFQLSASFR